MTLVFGLALATERERLRVMDIGHILCSLVMMFGFVVFGSYVFV